VSEDANRSLADGSLKSSQAKSSHVSGSKLLCNGNGSIAHWSLPNGVGGDAAGDAAVHRLGSGQAPPPTGFPSAIDSSPEAAGAHLPWAEQGAGSREQGARSRGQGAQPRVGASGGATPQGWGSFDGADGAAGSEGMARPSNGLTMHVRPVDAPSHVACMCARMHACEGMARPSDGLTTQAWVAGTSLDSPWSDVLPAEVRPVSVPIRVASNTTVATQPNSRIVDEDLDDASSAESSESDIPMVSTRPPPAQQASTAECAGGGHGVESIDLT